MSLKRTFAITKRIFKTFRHDKRSLAMMFLAPIVAMFLFGIAFSGDVKDGRTAVVAGQMDNFDGLLPQEGLPPSDGNPVGSAPQRAEHPFPLRHRQLLRFPPPDVAGGATGVTAVGQAEGQAHWQGSWPSLLQPPRHPVSR